MVTLFQSRYLVNIPFEQFAVPLFLFLCVVSVTYMKGIKY